MSQVADHHSVCVVNATYGCGGAAEAQGDGDGGGAGCVAFVGCHDAAVAQQAHWSGGVERGAPSRRPGWYGSFSPAMVSFFYNSLEVFDPALGFGFLFRYMRPGICGCPVDPMSPISVGCQENFLRSWEVFTC